MDTQLLRAFQAQIELQCRAIMAVAHNLEQILAPLGTFDPDGPPPTVDHDLAWIAVQSFLGATANISKACWGQRGKHAAVRAEVRESLTIEDSSPFRDPDMRNNFEHYDERLDVWWETSTSRNYVTGIFPISMIQTDMFADVDLFRVLDPTTLQLRFWGQPFDLNAIAIEAHRVLPIAHAEAAKLHF